MAQGSPDAREKLGGADRLGQIIIRAEVERTYLFLFLRAGGEDDDRDAGPGADLADDLYAVHVWKPQVEENQIRALGRDDRKCFFSRVCGGNAVILCGQGGGDEVADVFFIFY